MVHLHGRGGGKRTGSRRNEGRGTFGRDWGAGGRARARAGEMRGGGRTGSGR